MSQPVSFPEFLRYLQTSSKIELCERPDEPWNEEFYKFLNHQLIDTTTGQVLILELQHLKNEQIIKVNYPDIQNIEINNLSNSQVQKFYINCNSRKGYFQYQDIIDLEQNHGVQHNPEDKHKKWTASQMVFRIMTYR
ncbi:hypothetical protein [Paenibacillus glycanilyticus]|uniref:hypothetical protein n=1 Tax=Paenibacillus glycanilyticus TaxID=126569 RepID=UPI000FD8C30B|nr:hypothetical protein [Paenibacillus glycanilyticus]